MLFEDLLRHDLSLVTIRRNYPLSLPGIGPITAPIHVAHGSGTQFIIALHGPLTPDEPPDAGLTEVKEFCSSVPLLLVDEMLVRRNLPAATSRLIGQVK